MCIINYHIYLLKTPLSIWIFNIFISNVRFLSTHTHLLNDYESEIRGSNQKSQRRDYQDGPNKSAVWTTSVKEDNDSDETRAPIEEMRAKI